MSSAWRVLCLEGPLQLPTHQYLLNLPTSAQRGWEVPEVTWNKPILSPLHGLDTGPIPDFLHVHVTAFS